MSVIWHDIECGAYGADIDVWRSLARERADPVLDIGAGTGRITLDLARHGHAVVALDRDPALASELSKRASGLEVKTVVADARDFELDTRFGLIIVPMQTIQLLGGQDARAQFLASARRHLAPDAVLAIAISEELELYEAEPGHGSPLPDIRELDGVLYSSQPTAVREDRDGFVLERCRETVDGDGRRTVERDVVRIDPLSADQLETEAAGARLSPAGRIVIPPTPDHVGSVVVMLRA
ncbi:MAG TPA: class I SAM-dependent methyltransferase [Solirubrobacteraceae bacterium]